MSIFGETLIALLAAASAIRAASQTFMPWVVVSPLIVVIGFQLDSIFIGATRAREMRDRMLLTAPLFILASLYLAGRFGNHGLWAAFTFTLFLRSATLAAYMPRIARTFLPG